MKSKYIPLLIVVFLSTGLTFKPQKLKIGDKAHGGIIAWIDDTEEHGLVAAIEDIGPYHWEKAKKECEEYSYMGKNDWYLPSKQEMTFLATNLFEKNIGNFQEKSYWTSTKLNETRSFSINLKDGYFYESGIALWGLSRPVRPF